MRRGAAAPPVGKRPPTGPSGIVRGPLRYHCTLLKVMRKFRSYEQNWISALLVALIGFNDPFFGLSVATAWSFWTGLYVFCEACRCGDYCFTLTHRHHCIPGCLVDRHGVAVLDSVVVVVVVAGGRLPTCNTLVSSS